MFKCVQCFIEFWKDFHADQKWKFPELPPSQFKKRLELNRPGVDLSELERAKWFWRRRPSLSRLLQSVLGCKNPLKSASKKQKEVS